VEASAETTARLSSFGARVILFDLLNEDDGAVRAPQLGAVAYKNVDQGHAEELQRAIEQVVQEFHRLDIVIGNAAVGSGGRLLDLTARQ
jgi:NAD(P)-dependent dehydrogenase (short-subunit alcohol dehydrogenase family)